MGDKKFLEKKKRKINLRKKGEQTGYLGIGGMLSIPRYQYPDIREQNGEYVQHIASPVYTEQKQTNHTCIFTIVMNRVMYYI